jgi:hypothetical protein
LPHRKNLELVLLAACLMLAVDIGREASLPLQHAFWMRAHHIEESAAFEQWERVPRALQYQHRDYAPEAVPAVLAGIGVLQCTMQASLNIWAPKAANGRPFGMGARGREASDYHGEAFTESGAGSAKVVAFSLNEVVVDVAGAHSGERLVLNQNFDPGWRVDGRATESYRDAISTVLTAPSGRLTFRFWPRGLSAGLVVLVLTLLGFGLLYWRRASAATLSP